MANKETPLLAITHLEKVYTTRFGSLRVQALADVSFTVPRGEYLAIMGESGAGKTTLLNILAALDRPTGGSVCLNGQDLTRIPDKDLAEFRRDHLGFVFQDFNLLDTLSVRDNILLPLVLADIPYGEMVTRLEPLALQLGIAALLDKYPYEISGGQKQRAAVARALITGRSWCWRTSPPAPWIPGRRTACWTCSGPSTPEGRPFCWSPTACGRPATPSGCCFCGTARCTTSCTGEI